MSQKTPAKAQKAPEPQPAKLPKDLAAKKAALDNLDEGLWGLYLRLRELQEGERRATISSRYDQGRILLLAESKHKQGLKALGAASGYSDAMLREMQMVARRIESDEVAVFIAAANEAPRGHMGWAHLCELASIADRDARARYTRLIAKEGLTVEGLRHALSEAGVQRYEYGSREGAGAPYRLPSTPVGILARVGKQTSSLARLLDQALIDDAFDRSVAETPPDKIGPDGLAKMQADCETLAALRGRLDVAIARAERAVAEAGRAIAAPAPAPGPAPAEAAGPADLGPSAFLPPPPFMGLRVPAGAVKSPPPAWRPGPAPAPARARA